MYEKRLSRTASGSRLSSKNVSRRPGSRATEPEAESPRLSALLDHLEALFLREGFQHLTIDEIAQRLQCSKTTLYRLAPSSEKIIETVVDRFLRKVRSDGLTRARKANDWYGALIGLLGAGVTGARDVSWEFVRDMRRHPGAHRQLMRHQRQRVTDLERLIEAGARSGAFHDIHPRLVAELLQALMWRVFEPDLLAAVGLSLAEAYEETYRIVEYGLVPRGNSRSSAAAARQLAKLWTTWPSDH